MALKRPTRENPRPSAAWPPDAPGSWRRVSRMIYMCKCVHHGFDKHIECACVLRSCSRLCIMRTANVANFSEFNWTERPACNCNYLEAPASLLFSRDTFNYIN